VSSRLDPRAPLVLDIRELGRRPGAMQKVVRSAPAPKDLAIDVIGVPEGADIELDLRLESVSEGVLVSGTARAPVVGTCVRCLDPLDGDVEVDLTELFVYGDREVERAGVGDDLDAEDLARLEDDLIDLEPVLRDAVVLALPIAPVCREDCQGLCPQCGARLADDPTHHHDVVDPRWAALADLDDLTKES
jgi:uncharacterized protein